MGRPLIGIIAASHFDNGVFFYGLLPAYSKSVAQAGGLPLMIAPDIGEEALRAVYERLDGVLLAGGGDIDPALYGMADGNGLGIYGISRERDLAEINLVKWALADDKPTLGICRGCQIVNVALGGTLYRDIPKEYPAFTGVDHSLWGKKPRDFYAHAVTVAPTTRLAAALGSDGTMPVNSLHHQALRDIAPELRINATAEDGIVEGVEIPDARFFVAVQWHPEELTGRSAPMRHLFESFVAAAQ